MLALNSKMGADIGLIATNSILNPRHYAVPIYVPTGGVFRKRVPRPIG